MKTSTPILRCGPSTARVVGLFTAMLCLASVFSKELFSAENDNRPGALDPSFAGRVDGWVTTILTRPDGHLLVGGDFGIPGVGTNLVRFTRDGAPDPTFAPSAAVWGMTKLAMQSDGKVLVGKKCGVFRACYGVGLSRLHPDGSEDTSLDFPMPPDFGSGVWSGFWTRALAVQPDGRIVVAGSYERDHFDYWYWLSVSLQRLLPDGSEGEFFSFTSDYVGALVLLPDQRLLVAGSQLARLNADGTQDTGFVRTFLPDPGFSPTVGIESCITQPDGKILIGGNFTNIQGHARCRIARIMPDGRLDLSFNPPVNTGDGEPYYTAIRALAVQADGRILVGGNFETMNGLPYVALARLNSDGSLDTTFPPIFGLDEDEDVVFVSAIALQGEHHALIGGNRLVTAGGFDGGDLLRLYLGEPSPRLSILQAASATFQLSFSYSGSYDFCVLTTTNLSLPASSWSVLGFATNIGSGFYQFTDRVVRPESQRFYRLRGMDVR